MPISKAQQEAVTRYNNANYENIRLRVPAGRKHLVEKLADDNNMSINMAINALLAQACGVQSLQVWNDPAHTFEDYKSYGDAITIKVPPGRKNTLRKIADHYNANMNDLINTAIIQGLNIDPDTWDTSKQSSQAAGQQGEQAAE